MIIYVRVSLPNHSVRKFKIPSSSVESYLIYEADWLWVLVIHQASKSAQQKLDEQKKQKNSLSQLGAPKQP